MRQLVLHVYRFFISPFEEKNDPDAPPGMPPRGSMGRWVLAAVSGAWIWHVVHLDNVAMGWPVATLGIALVLAPTIKAMLEKLSGDNALKALEAVFGMFGRGDVADTNQTHAEEIGGPSPGYTPPTDTDNNREENEADEQ